MFDILFKTSLGTFASLFFLSITWSFGMGCDLASELAPIASALSSAGGSCAKETGTVFLCANQQCTPIWCVFVWRERPQRVVIYQHSFKWPFGGYNQSFWQTHVDHSCRWGILSPNWNLSNAILQSLQDRRGSKKLVFWILYSTEMAILRPNTTAIIKDSDVIFIYIFIIANILLQDSLQCRTINDQILHGRKRKRALEESNRWGSGFEENWLMGKNTVETLDFMVNKTWFPDVSCRCPPTNKSIDPVVVSWIGRIAFSPGRMPRDDSLCWLISAETSCRSPMCWQQLVSSWPSQNMRGSKGSASLWVLSLVGGDRNSPSLAGGSA